MAGAFDAAHVIPVEDALTLNGLFRERVKRTPDLCAYRYFDAAQGGWQSLTWAEMDRHVGRWQAAFERDGLVPGDRVAIMLRNCPEWVIATRGSRLGSSSAALHADRPTTRYS